MMWIKKIVLIFVYFLYIFHVSFKPLPYFLRTRFIIALFALFLIFLIIDKVRINKKTIWIIVSIISVIIPVAITTIINGTFDTWFVKNIPQQLSYFLSAYFVILISYQFYKEQFDLLKVAKLIVFSIAFHNLISTAGFLFPPISNIVLSIQNQTELADGKISKVVKFQSRMVGMGIGVFFIGGILNGFALILLGFLFRSSKRLRENILYFMLFIFIFLTGLFTARTTIVGGAIGILIAILPIIKKTGYTRRGLLNPAIFYSFIAMGIIVGIVAVSYLIKTGQNTAGINLAFEMFINLSEGRGLQTRSSNHLKEMYIFPDNFKTWIIGDGKFQDGGSFYMGVDVGYLRQIYYFGIFGLLFYYLTPALLCYYILKLYKNELVKILVICSFFYLLLLNLKGMADINYFLFLLFWTGLFINKRIILSDKRIVNK